MRNKVFIISGIILIILISLIIILNKISRPLSKDQDKSISLSALLNQAKDQETKGDLLAAKSTYQELMNNFSGSSEIVNWQKKMENLNIKLMFSSALTPKSRLYEIRPGDTLERIARKFKTTMDLIMKSNNLLSDKIVAGRKIKIWTAPLSILVDKSQNTLMLKTDEEIIKTYLVSTGSNNSTPTGTFKIVSKLQNPTWFKAGAVIPPGSPENILGTRWLGFNLSGYGIHGTTDPQNLGKQVTEGCVRMSNHDIEELYTIVPQNTEVIIVD